MSSPTKLFEKWKELTKLHTKQGHTILELIAHPETTPEMLQEALPAFRETRAALRKYQPVVVKALIAKKSYRAAWSVEAWKP